MLVNSPITTYKALNILVMLYITIMLIAISMVYNIVTIYGIDVSASTVIMPFWFFLGDVITEVYGYSVARKIIWTALLCEFIFVSVCSLLIRLPPSASLGHADSFYQVFGNLPRVFLGSLIGILLGSFLNSFFISKWKILTKGRYFWLRSIGSSAIGELLFTMITIGTDYLRVFPFMKVIELIATSFLVKVSFSCIASIFSNILAFFLKKIESIDVYDYNINFNPFKLDSKDNLEESAQTNSIFKSN